jgi:GntR family transcriptional regulator, transcriptional repressor for pyruvate dehydrogenase complex
MTVFSKHEALMRVDIMKNSDKLFQHFESTITEGSLRTGARLPSERQLAETFAISRSSVREVLQRLNAQGLITSKPGGGHFASKAFRQKTIEPLLALFNSSPESRFDLLEFRHTIEGDCAYYAALRSNELDRQALTLAFQRMDKAYKQNDLQKSSEADADFHLSIAESSHNIVYLHLMQSLFEVVRSSVFVNVSHMVAREPRRDILMRQHSDIYDAIMNAQPTTAREAAHRHIRYVEEVLSDMRKEQDRLERSERRYSQ